MSSKQLAWTVTHGALVSFHIADQTITGYLCGMDDFHWMVITPELDKHLVHKGSASLVTLSDKCTLVDEGMKSELEKVVGPFRDRVKQDFFGQKAANEGERA